MTLFNPFITKLDNYSNNELVEKISDLQKRYFMTSNPDLQQQIQASIQTFQDEIQNRKTAEMLKSEKDRDLEKNDLDKLIKVR